MCIEIVQYTNSASVVLECMFSVECYLKSDCLKQCRIISASDVNVITYQKNQLYGGL